MAFTRGKMDPRVTEQQMLTHIISISSGMLGYVREPSISPTQHISDIVCQRTFVPCIFVISPRSVRDHGPGQPSFVVEHCASSEFSEVRALVRKVTQALILGRLLPPHLGPSCETQNAGSNFVK